MALDSHFLAITAIITVGYQLFFFMITALLRFDTLTDFAGTTNFILLAILTLFLKGTWHFRQIVLTSLVLVWGLRLGVFLLLRILQWGEDRRLDKMRNNLGSLAVFWTLQALWVWTVSLPVTVVNASDSDPSVKLQDVIGWIMWLVGLIIEAVADQQKLAFKKSPPNRWRWCNIGVWKYSRHPNYFGEASADKRYGGVREYRIYKSTTSPLIPLPPSVYGSMPTWCRVAFLLELPLYSH